MTALRRGHGVLLAALLAVAGAGALLPSPAPEALVVQGITRLLARDAGSAGREGLFGAISAAGGSGAPVALRVTLDGAPLEGERLRNAVRARLSLYRDATGPADPRRPAVTARLGLTHGPGGLRATLHAEGPEGRFAASADSPWRVPGRSALLPPLIAIGLALLTQRTLLSLFAGVASGAIWLAVEVHGWPFGALRGLWNVVAVYLREQALSQFRIEIIGFIVALMGMVGIMSRAGGVQGLVDRLLAFARTLRAGLLLTYAMGLALFFDDYANCMLVGSTMRPLTDRLRVSREKLAYLVDSTAAPVAGLSLFSTWIAFQVSVYAPQLPSVGIEASGYEIFLHSLPYRFYSLLALAFVLFVVLSGRDFGPMARAERRARGGALLAPGKRPPIAEAAASLEPHPSIPRDWHRAAVPVLATAGATALAIFAAGGGFQRLAAGQAFGLSLLSAVLAEGSGPQSIFAGSLVGLAVACALAGSNATRFVVAGAGSASCAALVLSQPPGPPVLGGLLIFAVVALPLAALARVLWATTARPHLRALDLARASLGSAPALRFAVVLLFLAWMIGAVCEDLGTADYLVALLGDALAPALLPVLLFLVSCVVAFATGSSWSTMSILLPNVVGLAGTLGASSELGAEGMVVLCVSAVLEGAIFGDHCSPLSDTTVLSSVAAGSDHIDHVKTQAPYALCVALAALLAGYLPLLLVPGWGPWSALLAGAGALLLLLLALGRVVPPARLAAAGNLQ